MKKLMILTLVGILLFSLAACGSDENLAETTAATEEDGVTVYYYHGDQWGDNLVEETSRLQKLTAQGLLDILIEEKVLPEGVRVRNFRVSQDVILLDITGEFQEEIMGKGSTGEYVMMGALVNTFLKTYDASGMELTVEGQHLATGHDIYDYILKFYE